MKKIFYVAALIMGSHAGAQDTLENVTLTANKFSTKTTETGKVVITISRQQIEKAGSRDLAQVITELGGVFINGYTNNAGKEKNIYLRGAKVDYTLITVDGIPVYDASGIGSNFDIRYLPIDLVERVELLKGSQSTLYGSDALAGVINIITRKGGTKPFSVNGTAHYGSYNSWRASTAINGTAKKVEYNVGFTHNSTKGFSEAAPPFNATTKFERDDYKQNAVQASLGVQATTNWRLAPFLRYSKNSGGLDYDAFGDELNYRYDAKNLQTGIRNIINLGKAQVNVVYQLNNTERNYLDDSTFRGQYNFFRFNKSQYKATEHFAEAFVLYPFNSFRLTAGTDFRSSNTDYSATQVSDFSRSADAQSGDSVAQNQVGAYAALHYTSGTFSVEGGGRFNQHSEYGSNAAFNINPSYFIKKRVKVFANASSGYKTPSLFQLFSVYGNKDLQPETSVNLEVGAQVFTGDNKGALRATYFNRRVNDVIVFFYNPATFSSSYINQDEQKDHGVDVDGTLSISDKIQTRILYSYVDGRVTTKQAGKDTTFFNLLRRPKSTLNIFLGTQISPALYASINLNAVGERKDVFFDPTTFRSSPVTLKNYTLVNFYTEYSFAKKRIRVFADLRNVFDESYTDVYGYNTAGFNAYGGVRFAF